MQLASIRPCTKIILLGELNISRYNTQLQNFQESLLFERLIQKSNCYKGDNPKDIDHFITNIPKRFMKSMASFAKINPKLSPIAAKKSQFSTVSYGA